MEAFVVIGCELTHLCLHVRLPCMEVRKRLLETKNACRLVTRSAGFLSCGPDVRGRREMESWSDDAGEPFTHSHRGKESDHEHRDRGREAAESIFLPRHLWRVGRALRLHG